MAVIKLGDLTTFSGDTSGSYLVINDSTNTATYKVHKEQLLSGSFYGTASWAENAATASYVSQAISASYAITASYVLNGMGGGESVGSKLYLFNAY